MKRVIKKTSINSLEVLNKENCLVIDAIFFKVAKYQIKNKTDLDLFSQELSIKRKTRCRIQYLH